MSPKHMRIKFTGRIEVEKNLNGLGYHCEIQGETIRINPEIWNSDASTAIDIIKKEVVNLDPFIEKSGIYGQKVMGYILSLFTPIKGRELVGALFNGISVIILTVISWHLFSFPLNLYSVIAIALAVASLLYVLVAFIQSASNTMKSDHELFIKRYGFSFVDGEYTVAYSTILKQIVRRKLQLIFISSMLLSIFILGIFSKSPLTNYLSGIFDLLGYLFAVFFLFGQGVRDKIVKGSNKSLYNRYSPFSISLIFFSLFFVKWVTHLILLEDFFLIVEFPLYVYFFIFSIYDVLRTK